MDTEVIVEATLIILGAAYVLSQLTGDSRDSSFVQMIEKLVNWMWRK